MAAKSKTYEIAFALNGKTNSSFNKTFNNANKMMGSLAKTAASIGGTLAAGQVVKDAVMTYVDFEQAMANVSAVTGETGQNLKELEQLARDMGSKTSKTATDAAEAIGYMGLAGWNSTQIMKGIEPVLRLSEAGMLDLGRTSDLVTDSMSALGLTVEDLPKYLDMVAQTSRKSNTNIDMLMEAMIVAGGTVKNLKVPMEEANALLGVLANRGKKGSEAGNSLNSILINLTSGFGQAGDAMEALGMSAFDSNGNFKGVTKTLLELNKKLSGLNEEQRNMYLSMIGGKEQINTLNALLSGVSEEYATLEQSIVSSDGALMEMANTMNDTTKGAWELFLSAMDEVKIKYASQLGPTFKEILKVASDKIPKGIDLVATSFQALGEVFNGGVSADAWNNLAYALEALGLSAGETRNIIMSLQSGSEMLGKAFEYISSKAVEVYGVISNNWSTIAPIIAGITGAMIANKVATLAMTAAQKGAFIIDALSKAWTFANTALIMLQSGQSVVTVAQWALNAAMAANPIGVVCVAIGALIAIGVALWQNWDTVKAKAFELWAGIQSAFGGIGEWFGGLWEGVKSTFKSFINFIIGGLNKIPQALNTLNFTVPEWVPGIGGQSMGFNLPMIPQFYTGTTGYNTPDTFIAGERGPELVTNAPGYKVFNSSRTKGIFGKRSQDSSSNENASFLFNPVINIYDGGGDVEAKVQKALQEAYKLWKKEMKEIIKEMNGKGRLAF